MRYKNLFPYQNRQLGLSEKLTPRKKSRAPLSLVPILLSNLEIGETLHFGKNIVLILSNDECSLRYRVLTGTGQTFNAELLASSLETDDWKQDVLAKGVLKTLPSLAPDYNHPLCRILERDPAVFRLQNREGWVINDALCLLSGNVQYD